VLAVIKARLPDLAAGAEAHLDVEEVQRYRDSVSERNAQSGFAGVDRDGAAACVRIDRMAGGLARETEPHGTPIGHAAMASENRYC
jgi:hypothetical protein